MLNPLTFIKPLTLWAAAKKRFTVQEKLQEKNTRRDNIDVTRCIVQGKLVTILERNSVARCKYTIRRLHAYMIRFLHNTNY